MTRVRILHISDLHARADWTEDQEEIVRAMIADAHSFANSQPFDLAIFSGDLTFSGQPREFTLAQRVLLDPLTASLALRRDQVLLVPGNHDVARDSIDKLDDAGLTSTLTDREAVNSLLDEPAQRNRACARLQNFERFQASYFDSAAPDTVEPLAGLRRMTIRGADIGAATLNTAWRCAGDHDKGRLLLGDRQTRRALKQLADADLRLVVMHHPLSWLTGFDSDAARRMIEQHRCIVLCGHEHESSPTSEMTLSGEAIYSRAGCLYETHSYHNSYTILDVDTNIGSVDMFVRTWWAPERREFDKAVHIANDGRLAFPLPAKPQPHVQSGNQRLTTQATQRRDGLAIEDGRPTSPPEIQAATLRAYTPLYKTFQRYTFHVAAVTPEQSRLVVNVGVTYGIVNPTSMRLEHRPGLTPVRPIKVTAATIGGSPVDLTNQDFHTERGLVVPVALAPESETEVDL